MPTVEWFDDDLKYDRFEDEDEQDEFYCPYTNGPKCAVLDNGWQIQELCEALDCEQIRFVQQAKRRKHKAA